MNIFWSVAVDDWLAQFSDYLWFWRWYYYLRIVDVAEVAYTHAVDGTFYEVGLYNGQHLPVVPYRPGSPLTITISKGTVQLFAVRKRSCGKVMFSQVFVCPWGLCLQEYTWTHTPLYHNLSIPHPFYTTSPSIPHPSIPQHLYTTHPSIPLHSIPHIPLYHTPPLYHPSLYHITPWVYTHQSDIPCIPHPLYTTPPLYHRTVIPHIPLYQMGYSQQVGGSHSTGMHLCYFYFWIIYHNVVVYK